DEKRARKEAAARAAEAKRQERLAKGKLAPKDMFKTPQNLELYSEWDGKGIPTKDKAGEDLAKGKLKKLAKEYAAQEKLHTEYLKSLDYLQYSSIAARALRRTVKAELQTEIAKREGMSLKYAKWESGKAGALDNVPIIETRPKVEN
ncbi:hypothetical protein EC988_004190, partial [Linderina pennispora]